jgi:ribonucleoside-diphosphate reductase alpha chain
MQMFDKLTDVVKQGGTRRGANMGILPYWHPEIKDFITMKCQGGIMENFNVSVAIDETFMKAVRTDAEIDLRNPRNGESAGKIKAKELFDLMVECAWKSGDPGFVVIDRINNSGSNPTPAFGQIESTNPCGEQPLLPWEPCNLGSLNLSNFVDGPMGEGVFDFERLGEVVDTTIRFLDDVIEVNNYPLAEIERMAKGNRRIGLGVMGWAEALVKLGIAYESPAALDFAEKLMGFINTRSLAASEKMAEERGAFPHWKDSIYDPESKFYRGETRHPRNCARTTIAPTGTIAIAAGLQGGGIEPFFGVAYTRYNAKALDALKNGKQPEAKDVFFEVNPLFEEIAEKNNYWGMTKEVLFKKIDANHKAVRGIAEIPAPVQKLFATAHDVDVETHLKVQAAFQRHTDNGVSKTINMPNSAKVEDVRRAYLMAYELGCKGVTVYRDGCKSQQVLNLSSAGPAQAGAAAPKKRVRNAEPFGVKSEYFNIKTGYGPLHIHINYDEQGPYQVFTNLPPLGTEISGLTSLIGILLSKYLEAGGDPVRVLKHLNAVKGDRPIGFGENKINSIAHGIAVALRHHLKATGQIANGESGDDKPPLELWEASQTLYCPSCYSSNVQYESGCSGPTCHDCGYSECG